MECFRFAARQTVRSATLTLMVALFVLCFVGHGISQAAPNSASIEGTVRNSQGAPVPAAMVHLQSKDGVQTLAALTDGKGSYRFSALRDGVYTLRVEMSGFADRISDIIVLQANETKTVNFNLGATTVGGSPTPSTGTPEFFDEPHFSVAGVTDTTNLGGHGSDIVARTRDTLSKDTSSLGGGPNRGSPSEAAVYESERAKVQDLLAHSETAELHHSLADIDEKLGNPVEAVHEYQRAAELSPSEANLFDWGSELLLHHAPEPALEVFQKGNRSFPKSMRMLLGMGAAWYAHGSFEEAVRRVCDASDLQPENPTPYLFLGRMQSAESRTLPDVVNKFARFAKLHPENALANYYYAVGIWKERKSPVEAEVRARVESLLMSAVRLDPKLADAYLQLGILHSEQKDLSKAISDYQHAIQVDPNAETAHYQLAQAYRQKGEPDKARAELKVYDELVKQSAENNERERHEIQQFVYTLRDRPASLPAK